MSLKGCVLGSITAILCAAAGLIVGGVIGYYTGLPQQTAHASSEEWFDFSSLAAPFGALVGAGVGVVVGLCVAPLAKLAGPAQAPIVIAFVLAAGLISEEVPRRYQQNQDDAYLQNRREQHAYEIAHGGRQSAIGPSTANNFPTGASAGAAAPNVWPQNAPSSTVSFPPTAPPTQDDMLDAQHAKIDKWRSKLSALAYPGAQETQDANFGVDLTLVTSAPVDTVGAYYRDQFGISLRRVQGNGTMVWVGDFQYEGAPMHLAIFGKGDATWIQMS